VSPRLLGTQGCRLITARLAQPGNVIGYGPNSTVVQAWLPLGSSPGCSCDMPVQRKAGQLGYRIVGMLSSQTRVLCRECRHRWGCGNQRMPEPGGLQIPPR